MHTETETTFGKHTFAVPLRDNGNSEDFGLRSGQACSAILSPYFLQTSLVVVLSLDQALYLNSFR